MPRITDFEVGEMVRCIRGLGGEFYYRTGDVGGRPTVSCSCDPSTPYEERRVAYFHADLNDMEWEGVSQKSIQGRMYFKDWYRETLCTSKTGTE